MHEAGAGPSRASGVEAWELVRVKSLRGFAVRYASLELGHMVPAMGSTSCKLRAWGFDIKVEGAEFWGESRGIQVLWVHGSGAWCASGLLLKEVRQNMGNVI